MYTIQLDLPKNLLVIAAGTGIYESLTIEELVKYNSSFYLKGNSLYTTTSLEFFIVAGTVEDNDYAKLFVATEIKG